MSLVPRFLRAPRDHAFLFGPRGTGKTTWLRASLPDAVMVDLLDANERRTLAAQPERLRERVLQAAAHRSAAAGVTYVVVDEVQRVPALLDVVHALIESQYQLRFVLTGSSARKLRRGGVNLLGGRASDLRLHPFLAAELGDDFDLDRALRWGMLPLVTAAADPADRLRSFSSFYLDQEVRAEGFARDIGAFSRFLEVMSFSHGAELNIAAVARETAVRASTVSGYLEILEDLLLGFRLPVFRRRARRRIASHPKFYYFDCGVFRTLRPVGSLDRPTEIRGTTLEGLVAQHLRAWCDYRNRGDRLFTWRTRAGTETDFVVYGPDEFWGIEVKHATNVRPEDLRGLRAFGDEYPEARRLLLYRGDRRYLIGGVQCLSVSDFLRRLHPDHPIAMAVDWSD